jgi:hypothetical protein
LRNSTDNIVISDCRFPNEIKSIRNAGGIVIRVIRGEEPNWFEDAASMNLGSQGNMTWALSKERMSKLGIHASETAWVGTKFDHMLDNNNTIDELFAQIKSIIDPALDPLDATERPLYAGLTNS